MHKASVHRGLDEICANGLDEEGPSSMAVLLDLLLSTSVVLGTNPCFPRTEQLMLFDHCFTLFFLENFLN